MFLACLFFIRHIIFYYNFSKSGIITFNDKKKTIYDTMELETLVMCLIIPGAKDKTEYQVRKNLHSCSLTLIQSRYQSNKGKISFPYS